MGEYAALILRIAPGAILVVHGYHKIAHIGLDNAMKFFAGNGFAGWMLYPVLVAEIGGGLCLILGVYTRLVAVLLLPTLIGAASVHVPNGFFFSVPRGGWSFPVYLVVTDVVVALLGAGAYALYDRSWRTLVKPLAP